MDAITFTRLPDDWAEHDAWAPSTREAPHMLFTDGRRVWLADWHQDAWRCCATGRCIPLAARAYAAFAVDMEAANVR